ncbi:MAG TPA: thiamine phosphate synthase [Vicinamibacterales bacterium]|nr:thiamine phosphate synthase [Vicinamibacterales bacterium]
MASWPSRPDPFPRLYAILDVDAAAGRGLVPLTLLEAWLGAGVRLVQLRAKRLPAGPLLELVDHAVALTRAAGATMIVNDRVDLARLAGADGVHVGQDDLPAAAARVQLGGAAIVGVSTHNEAQLGDAIALPVNYLAIGPVFATSTKERPDPVIGVAGVSSARRRLAGDGRALVAIGGITLDRVRSVVDAGADAVAVIGDLLVGDPSRRAREYLRALDVR